MTIALSPHPTSWPAGLRLLLAVSLLGRGVLAQEEVSLPVDASAAPPLEVLPAGAVKAYRWPLTPDGRRYTVTVFPLSGDPDLFVGMDPRLPWEAWPWRSQAGPLQVERVSFVPPSPTPAEEGRARVRARQDSLYLIRVTTTPWHLQQTAPGAVCLLQVEPRFGDATTLVADLSVQNRTATWYEVQVVGKDGKVPWPLPERFLLAPGQVRAYGQLAFAPDSCLALRADRTTRAARIYLACDVVARLLGGGRPLNPAVADTVERLPARLQPLEPVGRAFQQRNWLGGGRQLVAILRTHPDLLSALAEVLQASGLRIQPTALLQQIPLLMGGFRAGELGFDTARSPEAEEMTVRAVPLAGPSPP